MEKKNIITIAIISLVILATAGLTVYFLSKSDNLATETSETQNISRKGSTVNTSAFPSSKEITGSAAQNGNVSPEGEVSEYTGETEQEIATGFGNIKIATDTAVAGITFVDKNGEPALRYIEKGTGHIKELAFSEKIPTKVTNTTVTGVYDADFGKDGSTIIFRRLDGTGNNVQVVYGTILAGAGTTVEGEVGQLSMIVMPSNTISASVSPNKEKIFYFTKNSKGSAGIISDFKTDESLNKKTEVWTSPFTEWNAVWSSQNTISLLTKPSATIKGSLYALNLGKTNVFEKILGGIAGLTSLISPDGKKVVYSETTGTGFMTYWFDMNEEGDSVFPSHTLPEKCVWSKKNSDILYCGTPNIIIGNEYPDSWYRGTLSFSDAIEKIDLGMTSAETIVRIEDLGANEIDITRPILSEDENYLAFINKKDGKPFIVKIR